MSYLIKQNEILEKLSNILFNSFDDDFDIIKAEYDFIKDFDTISTSLSYEKNGKTDYYEAPVGVASENLELCEELRALMKEHTGGEWTSFTLTLDTDGRATTKFVYPED